LNHRAGRQYELKVDGDWHPAKLQIERNADEEDERSEVPADRPRDALLVVNEFNIRQIEAACGSGELELRDDRGQFWAFRPRRIRFESEALAEGELQRTPH
jgi:hypothetical protein